MFMHLEELHEFRTQARAKASDEKKDEKERQGRSESDEAIPSDTIVGLSSHDIHPSTPTKGRYCRKTLARS